MDSVGSFRTIIELWPSKEAMASEAGAKAGAVSKWWQRDNIPAEWWAPILDTPTASDAGLTADIMTKLASRVGAAP